MPPTTSYKFGEVVLAPWTQTDGRPGGQRPQVVVSATAFNSKSLDIVVMPITSQQQHLGRLGVVEIKKWEKAGLLHPSVVKPVLVSIPPETVIKRLGAVDAEVKRDLTRAIATIFGGKTGTK